MRIINRAHVPWAIFVVLATIFACWLYLGNFQPQKLPDGLQLPPRWVQKPSEHRSVGGTPLGLAFGTIALAIFIFAALLGVRKKVVLWRIGTVQRWLRAHIWLTLLTVPLVILHSGFRFGGPMTTLLLVLYTIVMVSGIYGLALQHQMPRIMMERLPAESVYEQIPHIRGQLYAAAEKMRKALQPAPAQPTDAGAPAPSAAKAVVAGSTPMASTTAELSTPTARAKTAVGSTITAESVVTPSAPKTEEKISPSCDPELKPRETMGTPTARVPEGGEVPSGTERVSGVAPAEVMPRSVNPPAPVAASAAAPGLKPPPTTVAQSPSAPAAGAVAAVKPAPVVAPKPVAGTVKVVTETDSEAALLDFLDRQILPYLAAKRGDRYRLGNARFLGRHVPFCQTSCDRGLSRSGVEEIQGGAMSGACSICKRNCITGCMAGCSCMRRFLLLLMLTMWHAFVTLFHY
jgi:hypothetical protein